MLITKELALEYADMLTLSALGPNEELSWNDVLEIINCVTQEQLDPETELRPLTDWVHAIAAERLGWRRRRPSLVPLHLPPVIESR
jgi:hypothetical protein